MSIINLEKTFENKQLVYFNLNNKIIECTCLDRLYAYDVINDNENFIYFNCNKVKVTTIYDIYKNIIYEPIQTDLFKNPIKNGKILKNLIELRIGVYITFIGAFIENNKLNGIEYYTNHEGNIYKCLYNNIELIIYNDIKIFNIYNNEIKLHQFRYKKDLIFYKNYNDKIKYTIYNNYIKIIKGTNSFYQTVCFYIKNLKIFKINKYYKNIENAYEKRNDNNEITHLMEYNNTNNIKKEFICNDINPPFSKPLRKNCIELINKYKKNINNYIKMIKYCLKKEKRVHNNLLLNCNLEMINST